MAGFFTGLPTPILSVGNAAVDLAPPFLKDFAVERFGTADKTVLLAGIYTVVAGVAAVAGLVGLRRPRLALALTALLGAVAVVAAGTDRTSLVQFPLTVLPALVALVVSLVSLAWMLTGLHPAAAGVLPGARRARSRPRCRSRPDDETRSDFDRRRFLNSVLATGAVAVTAGVGARALGGSAAVASRADITLPRAIDGAGAVPRGAQLDIKGITPYLIDNEDFYRIDTALTVPQIAPDRTGRCASPAWSTTRSS